MYEIPSLKYKYGDLEPHFDEETMRLHHTKHHQAYVDKLNKALESYPDLAKKDVFDLMRDLNAVPEAVRTAVKNSGGGHLNHTLWWEFITPETTAPGEKTITALDETFGGLDNFKQKFKEAATNHFASGWVWLVRDGSRLKIISTPNQDTPISGGQKVIIGIDLWEHAYYLKYQNRRADFIDAFLKVINWVKVEENLAS
jgi:Fe-Mn family superoxide dismutase